MKKKVFKRFRSTLIFTHNFFLFNFLVSAEKFTEKLKISGESMFYIYIITTNLENTPNKT